MEYKLIDFKVGGSHHLRIGPTIYKIHITHVVDSVYEGRKLVIYKWYGKVKRWWHEDMKDDDQLSWEINRTTV